MTEWQQESEWQITRSHAALRWTVNSEDILTKKLREDPARKGSQNQAFSVWSFPIHLFIGTYCAATLATYLTAYVFDLLKILGKTYPMADLRWILGGTPFFPVQVSVGLLLGWVLGGRFKQPSMLWIWTVPLAALVYAFVEIHTLFPNVTPWEFQAGGGVTRFSHWIGWGCLPANHCADKSFITVPFYMTVAYSLGALLARKFSRPVSPKLFWFFLVVALPFFGAFAVELSEAIRGDWKWMYVQPLGIAFGCGAYLTLYAVKLRWLRRTQA